MAPEALARVLGKGTGQGPVIGRATAPGAWGTQRRRGGKAGGPGVVGDGMGLEGAPLSLPHVSFDVIQAEGDALVRAAPFGLFLALPSSAQLVFYDLGRKWGGGWVGSLEPRPSHGPAPAPHPHSPHRRSQRVPAP